MVVHCTFWYTLFYGHFRKSSWSIWLNNNSDPQSSRTRVKIHNIYWYFRLIKEYNSLGFHFVLNKTILLNQLSCFSGQHLKKVVVKRLRIKTTHWVYVLIKEKISKIDTFLTSEANLTDGWICWICFGFALFHWCQLEFLGHQIFSLFIIYHLTFSLFVTKLIISLPTKS